MGLRNIAPTAWAVEKRRRLSCFGRGEGGCDVLVLPVTSFGQGITIFWGDYTRATESARVLIPLPFGSDGFMLTQQICDSAAWP